MKKILLDSSFIIAIFRKNDPLHQRAIENKEVLDNDCYISNGIVSEVITILGQKTKDIALVRLAYNYMKDNFTIINESDINMYTDNVFATPEQWKQWKQYFMEHFYDWQPKRVPKREVEREFSWFNLSYGLKYDFDYKLLYDN